MKKNIHPLTLMDEIHERLTLLRDYYVRHADSLSVIPCDTAEEETLMAIRTCIQQLMDLNVPNPKGRMQPLFYKASHWQAVFRIMADYDLGATDGDYLGFKTLVERFMPDDCRVSFSYEALRGISRTPFVRPFAKWHYDSTYFQTRKPYESMYQVASAFLGILRQNGLVKS